MHDSFFSIKISDLVIGSICGTRHHCPEDPATQPIPWLRFRDVMGCLLAGGHILIILRAADGYIMLTVLSGLGLLLLTLAVFSVFSLKAPKGSVAMSGMANAAVATFLIEAIHKYITGNLIGVNFLQVVGNTSGSMGGVAAAIPVSIGMGANPILAVAAGVAVGGIIYRLLLIAEEKVYLKKTRIRT